MSPRKERIPLTEDQQTLVAEAWQHVGAVIARYQETCRGPDYDGHVAERLVTTIERFDPEKAGLKTWAYRAADGACLDAMRAHVFLGPQFRGSLESRHRRPIVWQMPDARALDSREDWCEIYLATFDPPSAREQADVLDEITFGLKPDSRAILEGYYRDGLTMRQIGERLGVSESRVSQRIDQILALLRSRQTA